MGQSTSTEVSILHKVAPSPPSGWKRNGNVTFHVHRGETVAELLSKINEYRSPGHQIHTLYNASGGTVSLDTRIYEDVVTYYI